MEKIMSTEDRIRRAEELYEKRCKQRGNNNYNIGSSSINRSNDKENILTKEEKDIKLLKKIITQVIICALIYFISFVLINNNYIFSEDFKNKANEILSYDLDINTMYNDVKNYIINFNNENNIGGSNEEIVNDVDNVESTEIINEEVQVDTTSEVVLDEEELKIQEILNTTTFISPLTGVITSPFGIRESATGTIPTNHTGVDIAADTGTKIISSTTGEVVLASSEGDYGNHLKIQIGNVSIIYAHCNALYVEEGDFVEQGQEIAEVGSTGNSTRSTFTF